MTAQKNLSSLKNTISQKMPQFFFSGVGGMHFLFLCKKKLRNNILQRAEIFCDIFRIHLILIGFILLMKPTSSGIIG